MLMSMEERILQALRTVVEPNYGVNSAPAARLRPTQNPGF